MPEAGIEVKDHRRRKKRQIDWDKLHQIRHEHDLEPEEKMCSCCGRPMDCIGEDVTRELEYQRPKLEAHIHVRPKYACRRCKDGVSAAPLPLTADSRRHRRARSDHRSARQQVQ